jgi:colanic acid/amylovoran biosynthesis glycosyltransferase
VSDRKPSVVYCLTRFPKLSETFVAREIGALRARGVDVRVRAFVREDDALVQPEAADLLDLASYGTAGIRAGASAQLYWLMRSTRAYVRLWTTVVWACRRSPRFLVRSMVAVLVGAAWARELHAEQPDYVHAHFATHAATAAWVVGELAGIPFGFTAHAHDLFVDRSLLREKADAAALIVTISEFNRRFMTKSLGIAVDRIDIVRCGVDSSVFASIPRAENASYSVVCVATLEPKKGQSHLIEAARLLRDAGFDLRITLIGDGPDRKRLTEQIAANSLAPVVRLAGAADRSGVAAALAAADAFVLPSVIDERGRMEGIPVALMEAMAAGVPVVASSLSGVPELVVSEATGILVPPGDAGALALAIRRLHDDRTLAATCSAGGRARILDEFDLGANADRLLGLIEGAVANSRPTGAPSKVGNQEPPR